MKVNRNKAEAFFEQCIVKYASDNKSIAEITMLAFKTYNIPLARAHSFIKLDEASSTELKDIEIFWMLDCIRRYNAKADIDLQQWFTDIEIENYSRMKYTSGSIKFPLVLTMLQEPDSQYIGLCKASTLVAWRSSGFIRYNKNIQRELQTRIHKNMTYETVSLNSKSVNQMVELFKAHKFIPNVITLNIDDDETDFYYDDETKSLVINKINHLDLTDGYHRLVALSKVLEEDPSFDYTMELRITNFSETKANQFIYQEEQRTIIPKRTLISYNMDDIATKVVKRISENTDCFISGNLTRGGLCDSGTFTQMVAYGLINKMRDADKKIAIITVPKDFAKSLNIIVEADMSLLQRKMNVYEVRILAFCCVRFFQKDKTHVYDAYKMLIDSLDSEDKKRITSGHERQAIRILDAKLEKGGYSDV